jgi:ribosomal protein S26
MIWQNSKSIPDKKTLGKLKIEMNSSSYGKTTDSIALPENGSIFLPKVRTQLGYCSHCFCLVILIRVTRQEKEIKVIENKNDHLCGKSDGICQNIREK